MFLITTTFFSSTGRPAGCSSKCIPPHQTSYTHKWSSHMYKLKIAVLFAALVSTSAYSQGTLQGAAEGAEAGGNAAGPVGAIVGGALGAAAGTIGGILGIDDRPRFREYVVRERRPSYRYGGDLRVGVELPESGVTYYEVPAEYRARPGYAYTYVNERPVIVEKRTRRVVEFVD